MSTVRQLIILGGGKGTRLASRLGGLPKPLVDVGGLPLLQRQILHARAYGVEQVLVLVNHLADRIREFFDKNNNFGLDLVCIDDGSPRGTAGAVLAVLPHLAPDVFVMYGDTLLNVDLHRFYAFHAARPDAAATLFLHPNDHPQDSDSMDVDETGLVTRIFPYPHAADEEYPNLVNAALYLIRSEALQAWRNTPAPLDFAKDLFPAMVADGQKLYGYVSPEYIKDVGTPERLDKAEADWLSGRVAGACLARPQTAVFLDRDGTINKEVGFLSRSEQMELLPGAAAALRRLNKSGKLSVVVTNQAVVARGDCDEDGLKRIHNRMARLLGCEGAYVDRVYACIHHPDKGFPGERPDLKIACNCRKPGIGLLEQARQDMHIDFSRSWFVGDRTGDVLCAQRAGVRALLVHTGASGKDGQYAMLPDYEAADLSAAVEFMLETHPALLEGLQAAVADIAPGQIVGIGGEPGARHFLAVLVRDALRVRDVCAHLPTPGVPAPEEPHVAIRADCPAGEGAARRFLAAPDAQADESFFSRLLFPVRDALDAETAAPGGEAARTVRFFWSQGRLRLACA